MSCDKRNNSLEEILQILSIKTCKNVCDKILEVIPDDKDDNVFKWKYNNEKKSLSKNDLSYNWGYILKCDLSLRDGSVKTVEIFIKQGNQHKNPRFQLFNIVAVKEDDSLMVRKDFSYIGNIMFDTVSGDMNLAYEKIVNHQNNNYNYINKILLKLNKSGFEGWLENEVNFKNISLEKLQKDVERLEKITQLFLLTRGEEKNKIGDSYLNVYNFDPITDDYNIEKINNFFNDDKDQSRYWVKRLLDEIYYSKN